MPLRAIVPLLIVCLATSGVGASESPCAEARTRLRALANALEVYQVKVGAYPVQQEWLAKLKQAGIISSNFSERDPWSNPYVYRLSSRAGFDLSSVGPDGASDTGDDQVRTNDWAWTACKGRTGCW